MKRVVSLSHPLVWLGLLLMPAQLAEFEAVHLPAAAPPAPFSSGTPLRVSEVPASVEASRAATARDRATAPPPDLAHAVAEPLPPLPIYHRHADGPRTSVHLGVDVDVMAEAALGFVPDGRPRVNVGDPTLNLSDWQPGAKP